MNNTPHRFKLSRLYRLAGALRRGETVTAPRLARQFECAPRSALRDIEILRDEMRWNIQYNHQKNTWQLISAPEPVL